MTDAGAPRIPPWPAEDPSFGQVLLRRFEDRDSPMVQELSTDPYVPLTGTLPAMCGHAAALGYIGRQRQRFVDGTGFSFAIADAGTGEARGMVGLWLRERAFGRAQVGYAVAPSARGRGIASDALRALIPLRGGRCRNCTASSCTSSRGTAPPSVQRAQQASRARACCGATSRSVDDGGTSRPTRWSGRLLPRGRSPRKNDGRTMNTTP